MELAVKTATVPVQPVVTAALTEEKTAMETHNDQVSNGSKPGVSPTGGKIKQGSLVTDRSGHAIYLIDNQVRRWIPDVWSMQSAGLSPEHLEIIDDAELKKFPLGPALPSTVPSPNLSEGQVVETESGIWRISKGKLTRLFVAADLGVDFDPASVVFLPDSLIRSLNEATSLNGGIS